MKVKQCFNHILYRTKECQQILSLVPIRGSTFSRLLIFFVLSSIQRFNWYKLKTTCIFSTFQNYQHLGLFDLKCTGSVYNIVCFSIFDVASGQNGIEIYFISHQRPAKGVLVVRIGCFHRHLISDIDVTHLVHRIFIMNFERSDSDYCFTCEFKLCCISYQRMNHSVSIQWRKRSLGFDLVIFSTYSLNNLFSSVITEELYSKELDHRVKCKTSPFLQEGILYRFLSF